MTEPYKGRNYDTLTLDSIFPFGKYKGQAVSAIIVDDPGYLLWLRQEKWKTDVQVNGQRGDVGMSMDIHLLLDGYLGDNPKLRHKGYKRRYEDGPPIDFADGNKGEPIPTKPKEQLDSWGAW